MANEIARQKDKMGITAFLSQEGVKNQLNQAIGKNVEQFVSSVVSAVTVNPGLQECTNASILAGALLGYSLNLSPSPQLGQFYLVPYGNKKDKIKIAQFQMGYKGYIQLAIRSGQYRRINVLAIKEGELRYFDPLNEEIKVELMIDKWDEREKAPTIGYYAMFELVNGFRKAIYWSKAQMLTHADRYSQAFHKDRSEFKYQDKQSGEWVTKERISYADYEAGKCPKGDEWMYSSFWYQNFDGMAYKTMLRQLISKWGVMSIEMQKAFDADMAEIREDGTSRYVDNQPEGNGAEGIYTDATVSDGATDPFSGKEVDGQQELNSEGGADEAKR